MSNYLVPTYSICKSFSILLPNYLPRYYSNNYLGKTIFLGIANYLGITIYLIITIYLGITTYLSIITYLGITT